MQLGIPEDLLVVTLPQYDVSTMTWLLKGQILQATYVTHDPAFSVPQFDGRTGEKGIAPAIQRLVQEDFLQAPSGIVLLRHPLASIDQYSAARNKLIGLVNPVLQESRRYPSLPNYPLRPPITP